MRGIRAGGIGTGLYQADGDVAILVVDLLAGPLPAPARVVHLTTQTGGFGVLVEAKALHRGQVARQCKEAMQSGPQTVAANRKYHGFHVTTGVLHDVDHAELLKALDRGYIIGAGQHTTGARLPGSRSRIEGRGVLLV